MDFNTQPSEPRILSAGRMLDVHSVFPTIQGEGPFAGRAALFVRLAGCNLRCPLCDTQYTHGRTTRHVMDVLATIRRMAISKLVVITGGEPFRQNITRLCAELCADGYTVQVETNGALPIQDEEAFRKIDGVHIVVSPKATRVHPVVAELASAFKYVIRHNEYDPDDYLPTRALGLDLGKRKLARPPEGWRGTIYIQPADEQDHDLNALNIDTAVCAVLARPQEDRRLCLQLHKYAGLE